MRVCTVKITGLAPYSASRSHETPKLDKERPDQYEDRTWPNKAHIEDGKVFIPPMAFKMGVDRAAKVSGLQIPGKGKSTYTKFFESGVVVMDPVFIADEADMECERIHANADGVRGSGKRVWRKFPKFTNWSGEVKFYIFANEIPNDVFEQMVNYSGMAVGVGRFRPEKGGFFGRYSCDSFTWETM